MAATVERAGLHVAAPLARFIDEEALPGTGIDAGEMGTGELRARQWSRRSW